MRKIYCKCDECGADFLELDESIHVDSLRVFYGASVVNTNGADFCSVDCLLDFVQKKLDPAGTTKATPVGDTVGGVR